MNQDNIANFTFVIGAAAWVGQSMFTGWLARKREYEQVRNQILEQTAELECYSEALTYLGRQKASRSFVERLRNYVSEVRLMLSNTQNVLKGHVYESTFNESLVPECERKIGLLESQLSF